MPAAGSEDMTTFVTIYVITAKIRAGFLCGGGSRTSRELRRFPKCGAVMRVLCFCRDVAQQPIPLGYDAASVGDKIPDACKEYRDPLNY